MHQPHACLSVVIPCYNERDTVATVVDRVLASPWTAEVIVVDDGSTDGTRDVLAGLTDTDARLRVLWQPHNQGKGAALRRGFVEATARYVIVQDADLEYDPDEYGVLVQPLLSDNADVVFGSRFVSGQPHRVLYYWHSVGNGLLTMLSNTFTNLNLSDMETCYKVFRREVIQAIDLEEKGFGVEPEVTAKIAAHPEWRVYEVGISYRGRTYAEGKKIGWRDGVQAVWCILKYSPWGARVRRLVGTVRQPAPEAPTPRPATATAIARPADHTPPAPGREAAAANRGTPGREASGRETSGAAARDSTIMMGSDGAS